MYWALLFLCHQFGLSLYRFVSTLARNIVVANAAGMMMLLCVFLMDGFVIQRRYLHPWVLWSPSLPSPLMLTAKPSTPLLLCYLHNSILQSTPCLLSLSFALTSSALLQQQGCAWLKQHYSNPKHPSCGQMLLIACLLHLEMIPIPDNGVV